MEYLGGKPLCMNQYYQILSSCRVPGPKQDLVTKFSRTKKPPMHITVVHNYQVGDPPAAVQPRHGCRKERGRAQSQLPNTLAHMSLEQAGPGPLLSTGYPERPRPGGGPEELGPGQPRESSAGISSPSLPSA